MALRYSGYSGATQGLDSIAKSLMGIDQDRQRRADQSVQQLGQMAQQQFANELATSREGREATDFQNKQDELARVQQQRKAVNTAMISPDIFTNPEAEYIGTKFDSLGTDRYDSMTDAEKAEYNKGVEDLTSRLTSTYDTRVSSPLMTSKQAAANMQRSLISQGVDATTAIDAAAKYGASIAPAAPDTKALQEMAKARFTERNKAIRENAKGGSAAATTKKATSSVNPNAMVDPEVFKFIQGEYWGDHEDDAVNAAMVFAKLGLTKEQQRMALDMANPSAENLWSNVFSADKVEAAGLKNILSPTRVAILGQYLDTKDLDLLNSNLAALKAKETLGGVPAKDADISKSEAAYIKDMQTAMSPSEVDRRTGMTLEQLTFGRSLDGSTKPNQSTPKKAPTSSQVKELQETLTQEDIPASKDSIEKADKLIRDTDEGTAASNAKAITEAVESSSNPYSEVRKQAISAYKNLKDDKTLSPIEQGALQLLQRGLYGASVLGEGVNIASGGIGDARTGIDNLGIAIGNMFRPQNAPRPYMSLQEGRDRFKGTSAGPTPQTDAQLAQEILKENPRYTLEEVNAIIANTKR